jgi:hypothetical protein
MLLPSLNAETPHTSVGGPSNPQGLFRATNPMLSLHPVVDPARKSVNMGIADD